MSVTCAVRKYVRKAILAKVADKLKSAKDAADKAKADQEEKLAKAEELCARFAAEAQTKFVKEVKKLGLTFISDVYSWNGEVEKDRNRAIRSDISFGSFAETLGSNGGQEAKHNPSAERERFFEIIEEPQRIKDAADAAADKLLFELELGKVAKDELDSLLKELEVKV